MPVWANRAQCLLVYACVCIVEVDRSIELAKAKASRIAKGGPRTGDGCNEEWARMKGRCVLLLEPPCRNIHGAVAVDAWHPR